MSQEIGDQDLNGFGLDEEAFEDEPLLSGSRAKKNLYL